METLIGVQLFERRPHSLTLTSAGGQLLAAVIKSLDGLELALNNIRRHDTPTLRTLRVQMPPSFATHLAVPILRDFRRDNPLVDFDLRVDQSGLLHQRLEGDRLDVFIG